MYTGDEVFASLAMAVEEPQSAKEGPAQATQPPCRSSRLWQRQGQPTPLSTKPHLAGQPMARHNDWETESDQPGPAPLLKIRLRIPLKLKSPPETDGRTIEGANEVATSMEIIMNESAERSTESVSAPTIQREGESNTLVDIVSHTEMDIVELAKGTDTFNKFFSLILAAPERYGNFMLKDRLIYLCEGDCLRLGVPDSAHSTLAINWDPLCRA